jgi:cation diffusion facilitator family transporter
MNGAASTTSGTSSAAYVAAAANLMVAATKFGAAWYTGSSAMWSEGIHSIVDTANEALILYGLHRAAIPADHEHPFGHGRELYFWSFVVALLIFSLGAGFAAYQGISALLDPERIESPLVSIGVLAAAAGFEGWSWAVAHRNFRREHRKGDILEAISRSKNPAAFTILIEDTAALIGIALAFVGICLNAFLNITVADGAASFGIGGILAAAAVFLAREAKGLLIGEPAARSVELRIREIATRYPEIREIRELLTFQLGPGQAVALADTSFKPELLASEVARTAARFEREAKASHSGLVAVFLIPSAGGSEGGVVAAKEAHGGAGP